MNLEDLIRLIESGQHGVPFDVKVEEQELTKLANERVGDMAKDISVDINPQAVIIDAKAKVASLSMDVRMEGKPVLEDGHLRFDVGSLQLNRRPAPDFMRSQISNTINERLDPAELPLKVSRLELGDGWVEMAGETK